MVQDIPLTIAFLAGILSFLSPCVLPIVPGFISYIVGKSFADLQNSSAVNTLKLLPHIPVSYTHLTLPTILRV